MHGKGIGIREKGFPGARGGKGKVGRAADCGGHGAGGASLFHGEGDTFQLNAGLGPGKGRLRG
jgi:hypothetical protein